MRSRLLALLAVCVLAGCVTTTPPKTVPSQRPQGEWPALGWGTNTPSLAPVTNTVPR